MNIETLSERLAQGEITPPRRFQPLVANYEETVRFGYGDETRDLFSIQTSTGVYLNDFLPSRIKFCNMPGTEKCECAFGVIYLDLDYLLSLGEVGAIGIAHELGHTVNPDDLGVNFSPFIESEQGTDECYQEIFNKGLEQNNKVFRSEVEAWEYGHIFADLMGVNEDLYHSQMTRALTTYYVSYSLATVRELKTLMEKGLVNYDQEIEYYDIWNQETVPILVADLIAKTVDREQELIFLKENSIPVH